MSPLHPRQLSLLRLRFAIAALVLLAGVVVGDAMLAERGWFPGGIATGAGVLLAVPVVWLFPRRRYRAWGYDLREDELVLKHGLMIRKVTVLPFGRVQHIDVAQGPLERAHGLATLVLHTAGTRGAAIRLPGLWHADAERMRDHVRGKIRQDLM